MKKEIWNFLIFILGLTAIYFLLKLNVIGFWLIIIILIILTILKYIVFANNKPINSQLLSPTLLNNPNLTEICYKRKNFMTDAEYKFYLKLTDLNQNYIVIPQVNLASIIEKSGSNFRNELFRNIDFGIFDKNFNLLLLIELNDKTHDYIKRRDRDLKIKKILDQCNISLLTFYTCYPNEKQYVLNRIIKALAIEKNN